MLFADTHLEKFVMACWVVPSIAAEYLGIPLSRVLEQIQSGAVESRQENGFTFVDVAPSSPMIDAPQPVTIEPIPPTYRVVTREEIVALVGDLDFDAEDDSAADWRVGRSEASRMRRAPEVVEAAAEPVRERIAA